MDGGAWWAAVHGVAKSRTRLSDFTFTFHFSRTEIGLPGGLVVKNLPAMQETWVPSLGWEDPPKKETATHSSILAWEMPWTKEPGRL